MANEKEKLKNQQLKATLEELVSEQPDINVDKGEEVANARKEGQVQLYTDFNLLSTNAKEEGKKIVESIVKFYLDLDIIDKNEYVQYKKRLNSNTLSSTMFQMQTAEFACIKLLEDIDAGNANLKTFEVFSKMQDTMMKIVEVQNSMVSKMEEQWKKLRSDSEEIKMLSSTSNDEDEGSDNLRIKGSRNMIELAQKISEEKGINKQDDFVIKVDPREAYKESLNRQESDADEGSKIDESLF